MATLKTTAPATWNVATDYTAQNNITLWAKFTQFADSQKGKHVQWFFIVLMVHGVFFLPLPAVLMYYYNAPAIVLAVTMVSFFANLIATMGGAGIRTALLFFAASIAIHIFMTLVFVL
ncbi:hypothetical protein [Mucilaginibacter terrae]|uniref:Uncharacterized protein n=1 Tax=Mucilaginibacter terrae TaxID=1955052 RepID=A0ABU3GR85_9SPHI|nr:hypothetical protein [Mucilaginibacter terrae]MDT3401467.1 hypothetical protein [Mucilaginibacter terrae]